LLIFLLVVCVVFGGIVYVIFNGLLSEDSEGFGFHRPPRLRELPPGCLISLIVVGSLWFIAWGIVLLLAIRLLRTPLGE